MSVDMEMNYLHSLSVSSRILQHRVEMREKEPRANDSHITI